MHAGGKGYRFAPLSTAPFSQKGFQLQAMVEALADIVRNRWRRSANMVEINCLAQSVNYNTAIIATIQMALNLLAELIAQIPIHIIG
jgi:hypothetical protein